MNLADKCNPGKNTYLANMLAGIDCADFSRVEPQDFEGRFTVLAANMRDFVIVLHPGKGTGVIFHENEVRETAKYLGSVVEGVGGGRLLHKYQGNEETDRTPEDERAAIDVINKYPVGFEFDTIVRNQPVGRWHGYHNPLGDEPVAVLIHKEFE